MLLTVRRSAIVFSTLTLIAGTLVAGDPGCVSCEDRMTRAGNPNCVAPWAQCPSGKHEIGYYVGGGASRRRGELRRFDEGVWGVDAKPVVPGFRQATVLYWWHGRASQGGTGSYEPDHRNRPFEEARAAHSKSLSR